ncbi:MAG TPA: prolipoprotein diacylglyceryl transferase [Cellvibrio sp.]|nr:prolipoprotein diacylglyceryl transferase [Cellvibrio sp.]
MLQFPNFDPIAFSLGPFAIAGKSIGPLEVHWYGIMYLLAFASAWLIALYRCKAPYSPVKKTDIENLITYGAFGVILGGRVGYVIFYNFDRWMSDPLWLFRVWEGGMSFHGGLLGVIVAMFIYANRIRVPFVALMDFVAPIVPLGLGFGRLGNFIGQELWGRVSDAPWAMVFPKAGDPAGVARHPSQLYQATLEGLVMFVVLFWFTAKPRPRGAASGLFLVLYASFRSIVENFRQPDADIGFDFLGWVTRGQLLSLPLFILGFGLLIYAYFGGGKKAAKLV